MKDSEYIQELNKYKRPKRENWQNENGANCIVFIMSPKQWTEFRKMFNKVVSEDKK